MRSKVVVVLMLVAYVASLVNVTGSMAAEPMPEDTKAVAQPDAASDTTVLVKGVWKYEDNDGYEIPIPFARVEVWDQNPVKDSKLATIHTDENGYYEKEISSSDFRGPDIYVKVFTTNDDTIEVKENTVLSSSLFSSSTEVYGDRKPGTLDVGVKVIRDARTAPAWSIYETIVSRGEPYLKNTVGWKSDIKLSVEYYAKGNSFIKRSGYTSQSKTIRILSLDAWSDSVVLHEYGHFVMDVALGGDISPDPCPSSGHYWGQATDTKCAWTEGWADAFQAFVRNEPDFYFTGNPTYLDIELPGIKNIYISDEKFTEIRGFGNNQQVAITASLWDIYDQGVEDWDNVSYDFVIIWNLIKDYNETNSIPMSSIDDFYYSWLITFNNTNIESILHYHGICNKRFIGDINCDGRIDLHDYSVFVSNYISMLNKNGKKVYRADISNSGGVDLKDYDIWAYNYVKQFNPTILSTELTNNEHASESEVYIYLAKSEEGGLINTDIVVNSDLQVDVTGGEIILHYSPDLLEYQSDLDNYASANCQSINGDTYPFTNQFRITDNPTLGTVQFARAVDTNQVTLPQGNVCLGTIAFKVRQDVPTPSIARISLDQNPGAINVVSPEITSPAHIDPVNGTTTINIGNTTMLPSNVANFTLSSIDRDRIILQWDDASSEAGYHIYRWVDTAQSFIPIADVTADTPTYTDTSVSCGSEYLYQISAYNSSGESARTDWIRGNTPGCLPAAPTIVTISSLAEQEIVMTWQDNAANEQGFEIHRKETLTGEWQVWSVVVTDSQQFTDSSVMCNTDYQYRIIAFNESGTSSTLESPSVRTLPCSFFDQAVFIPLIMN